MAPIEVKQNSCWVPVRVLNQLPSSDTGYFVNLPYTIIHASRAQFPSPPGSGVNLTPEPGNILLIALFKRTQWSEAINFRQSCTCLQNLPTRENRLFISSNSRHLPLWEALQWHGWGARYVCVGSWFNTRTGAQHEFCFTSMGAIFKYT